jgi:hypothetical protein
MLRLSHNLRETKDVNESDVSIAVHEMILAKCGTRRNEKPLPGRMTLGEEKPIRRLLKRCRRDAGSAAFAVALIAAVRRWPSPRSDRGRKSDLR